MGVLAPYSMDRPFSRGRVNPKRTERKPFLILLNAQKGSFYGKQQDSLIIGAKGEDPLEPLLQRW